jgi:hypothetical protein
MAKKSVLIICRNNLSKAPRFLMEVDALSSDYNIFAAGLSTEVGNNYMFLPLHIPLEKGKGNINFHFNYPFFIRKIISSFIRVVYYKYIHADEIASKKDFKTLSKLEYQIVIVHHFVDLPLGVKLAKSKKVKLIFNAHEYYPLEFDNNAQWMATTHIDYMKIANKYLKYVDMCFCVGNSIALKYKQEFDLNSVVITNSKPFYELNPQIISSKIRLIHHGLANEARKIELMINMMKYLGEGYILDLMLVSNSDEYLNELKKLALDYSNINFIEPVNINDIPKYTNQYDIGVFLLPPTNFNYTYALPNKFFEFIQARLAIAIGPSPEMAAVVKTYDLGVVAEDFEAESLAKKIKELSVEKIMYYKKQCNKYASDLCVEKNWVLIKETVDRLIR